MTTRLTTPTTYSARALRHSVGSGSPFGALWDESQVSSLTTAWSFRKQPGDLKYWYPPDPGRHSVAFLRSCYVGKAVGNNCRKGKASMKTYLRIGRAGLMIGIPLVFSCSPGSDLPPLPQTPVATPYQLGSGDRLAIKVLGADELAGEYNVQDDGTIRVLMIGKVRAAGATPEELEAAIAQKLKSGRYITNPQVNVSVVSYRPFYILGEVARPGGYPYASGMRVLSAVASAQGYTYRANQDYVIITRNGVDERADVFSSIQPDDIIRVPERYF